MAKIVVIVGSVRTERHGIKVAKWVVKKLKEKIKESVLLKKSLASY